MKPLNPARLAFTAGGTPYSPSFDDVYHSADGGSEQARHVFLAGNELPARWQGRGDFVILEIGFGFGLNFLTTWQVWREAPGGRLHYVAIEKHPFLHADLAALHARYPSLASLAGRLQAQWPLPLPGLHRLDFGEVVLTLAFGAAEELLPQLELAADAFYLDGFAPEKNPEPWSAAVCQQLARLAAPEARLATWTVAGSVRAQLSAAGFLLSRRPGFGRKREMLTGIMPSAANCRSHKVKAQLDERAPSRRRIAVIGAGIAGASIAHALARRGHEVTVVEAAARAASGASGNHAGVFRPLPSANDGRQSRLLRAGFLLGHRTIPSLPGARYAWCGALHIARDERHEKMQRATAAGLPEDYCRFVEREEAMRRTGWPVERGGWWFPLAGWLNPPSICRALLYGVALRVNLRIERLVRQGHRWQLIAATGQSALEADEVVLANGIDAPRLAAHCGLPLPRLPIRPGRGLVSHLPGDAIAGCQIVATRSGYVTPAVDGIRCAGATLAIDDGDTAPRLVDHQENLLRLEAILPGAGAALDPARLDGRVSFRPLSPDKLPLVGPVSASDGLWLIGGFGARGLVYAPICAELLASQIDGEPLPLETDLALALTPARFSPPRRP